MFKSVRAIRVVATYCALNAAAVTVARQNSDAGGASPAPASQSTEVIQASPPFEQVTPLLDFGYRKPLSFEQGIVTLVNMGDSPLKIRSTRGECVCTVATANKDTVQPGESVDLLIGLEVPPELGPVEKKVLVEVEGYQFPFLTSIYAESGLPVRVNGGGNASIVVDRVGRMTLDSIEGRPFTVLGINGRPPKHVDFNPDRDRPRAQYVVEYDFSDLATIDLPRRVIVETDHPDARMIDVQAMLNGAPKLSLPHKWRPVRDHIVMGAIPMDQPSITMMVMTGKPMIPGERFTCRSRSMDARVDIVGARMPSQGGGIQIDLKVTPRGGFQGFLHAIVDITLENDSTALEIFARVMPADQIPPDAVRPH